MPRGKGNKATKGAPASPATPTTVTPSRSAFRSIAEADLAKAPGWLQRADDMNSFFWKMDVKQWRLVRRGGKKRSGVPELVDLEAILGRQKRVRVLGVVRNSVTGEERELQSEPLEEYTVQRLPGREGRDFEYRVWLQLTIKVSWGGRPSDDRSSSSRCRSTKKAMFGCCWTASRTPRCTRCTSAWASCCSASRRC